VVGVRRRCELALLNVDAPHETVARCASAARRPVSVGGPSWPPSWSLCALPSPARAFDTQPHFDITRDALTAEGFGLPAASIAGINNWFVDYYTNPDRNAHSGHASFLLGWTRLGLAREDWPNFYIEGARRLHRQ
jgi:hypothetical protein